MGKANVGFAATATAESAAAKALVAKKPADPAKYGFKELGTEYIAEYGCYGILYEHSKTGAQLMSLIADDENKTFGVVLRTPPTNSTGIPHILEHSVLCGSKKYPIKEPFVELLKGSLNTFLNAFTYPDRTCYPVASTNVADFYNLVDVYIDAVFFPRCVNDKSTFEQEGWHIELEDPSKPTDATYKGVVYNEMKGVYSNPESVLGRDLQQSTFPSNTYGVDSGGDPKEILNLSFEEFQDFHAKFYHPTNSRFWFYGDDDPEKRLAILSEALESFEKRTDIESKVERQALWTDGPKQLRRKYAASAEEGPDGSKSYVAMQWLLHDDKLDLDTEIALGFLDHLMLGTVSAPLRKKLLDSKLGEALTASGIEDELMQPTFSVGLKGVKEEDLDKVEPLVMEELRRLAEEGFDAKSVEASVNTIEFALRENNTGRFPRGLSLMLRSMTNWLYDRDPFTPLRFEEPLQKLKARIEAGEDVWRPLIQKYLLDNSHKVTLYLEPDKALAKATEEEEKARIVSETKALGEEDLAKLVENTKLLKKKQETPDTPEALKCVPSLSVSDIPKEAKTIPIDVRTDGLPEGAKLITHDIFTNDIVYAEMLLPLRGVPKDLVPYVPLFARCIFNVGTTDESLLELQQRIGSKTGGISASCFTSDIKGEDEAVAYIMIRGKCTRAQAPDLFALAKDAAFKCRVDDEERITQMVLESKASYETSIVAAGHRFASSRLHAMENTEAGWLGDAMGGLGGLYHTRSLAKSLTEGGAFAEVSSKLEQIRQAVLNSNGSIVNLTGDAALLAEVTPLAEDFMASLPANGAATCDWASREPVEARNELLTVPTQVNYVAKSINLYKGGYDLHGASYVVNKQLNVTWLWDRVRVSGGAYGGFCDFDTHSGLLTYASYRDPNLLKTLDVYSGTPGHLKGEEVEAMDSESLEKAVVGTIGDVDSYQLPDAKGYSSLLRHILKVSDEQRQQRRDEILATTKEDFASFGDVIADAEKKAGSFSVAVCSAEAAEKAKAERPDMDFAVVPVL